MKLAALFIHPIKSCAGIAVERAQLTRRGLLHDRRWMVVDENGKFLSQRTLPAMALVRTALDAGGVHVERAGLPPLALPLSFSDGPRLDIAVWSHRGPAVRHEAGSAWFTRALARPAQLVCLPDELVRPVRYDQPYDAAQPHDEVSFADGFPLLVANAASLDDLNARSGVASEMRRFRPNLVVAGAAPWAEDDWQRLRVGAVGLRLPTACARCSVPGIDPDRGVPTPEPLRTLAQLRRRDHHVYFGVNAVPDEVGALAIGDEVEAIG